MRTRIFTGLCVSVIASASIFSASLAEARVEFSDRQGPGEVQFNSLIGAPVRDTAGETIGKLSYLLLDGSGRVTTAVLGIGGFLGMGEKNVGIPFASLKTEAEDGQTTFRLDATRSEIEAAPQFVWTVNTLASGPASNTGSTGTSAGGASTGNAVNKPAAAANDATKDREPMSDAVESDSVKKKTDQPETTPNTMPGSAPGAPQDGAPPKTK